MEDLSLHILDVAENAIRAGARSLRIRIREDLQSDLLELELEDDGQGMKPELLAHALDPFVTTRTTRRVGLGLPFLADAAREAGGEVTISSVVGRGTCVRATFRHSHIDRKPLGDVASSLISILLADPQLELLYEHTRDDRRFVLDTRELRQALDPVPLDRPEVIRWLGEYVRDGLGEIGAGEE